MSRWKLGILTLFAVMSFSALASASVSRRNLLRHDPRRDEALLGIVTAVAFGVRALRRRTEPRSRHSLF